MCWSEDCTIVSEDQEWQKIGSLIIVGHVNHTENIENVNSFITEHIH